MMTPQVGHDVQERDRSGVTVLKDCRDYPFSPGKKVFKIVALQCIVNILQARDFFFRQYHPDRSET